MAEHAERIYQPSSFKRTINCPGWGQYCKRAGIKPKPSGEDAAMGSVAHHLAETCLTKEESPSVYLGGTGFYNNGRTGINCSDIAPADQKGKHYIFPINDEMVDAVQVYLDEIYRKRQACLNGIFTVEQKLDLSWLVPGMFGTGDHIAIEPLGTLYVDDYKNGAGVIVEVGEKVGDNPQLSIYALGALGKGNPYMVEEVCATIVQPRAPHSDGSIRSIRYNVEELYWWGANVLLPAAEAARDPNAPLKAGDWCQWCDAEGVCPELRKHALQAADVMFGDDTLPTQVVTPPDPVMLDGPKLDRILEFADIFEAWLKAVKAEAYERLEQGALNAPNMVKLVSGKLPNRAWQGTDMQVFDALKTMLPRADIFAPEVVKSPAQMEKALMKVAGMKRKDAQNLLFPLLKTRTPGKTIMVSVGDPRPALPPATERMFPD